MSTTDSEKAAPKDRQKPRASFKFPAGKGAHIEVAVFQFSGKQDDGGDYTTDSIVVHRSYHDGQAWKRTQGFRASDLPVVALGMQRVWQFLMDERNGNA